MDALFENAPLFIPRTAYAKVADYRAAERELRQGSNLVPTHPDSILILSCSPGTFVPGNLTEKVDTGRV
jgi:hypothetical protein